VPHVEQQLITVVEAPVEDERQAAVRVMQRLLFCARLGGHGMQVAREGSLPVGPASRCISTPMRDGRLHPREDRRIDRLAFPRPQADESAHAWGASRSVAGNSRVTGSSSDSTRPSCSTASRTICPSCAR
jgi:hypothetical protein